jgi:hypothetical protein
MLMTGTRKATDDCGPVRFVSSNSPPDRLLYLLSGQNHWIRSRTSAFQPRTTPSARHLCLHLRQHSRQSLIIQLRKRNLATQSVMSRLTTRLGEKRLTTSPTSPPPPKTVPSALDEATTFLTRSSKTPDQFHSPGLRAPPGCAALGDKLRSLPASPPLGRAAGECARFSPKIFAR